MISVIVPVYNEEKAISNFLQQLSVALSGLGHYEIIIVDDGSKDSSLKEIKGVQISGLRIIEHDENLGYGKSLYDGIVAAKYDCIAIIDGDCSYPPGEIKNMLKEFSQIEKAKVEFRPFWVKLSPSDLNSIEVVLHLDWLD